MVKFRLVIDEMLFTLLFVLLLLIQKPSFKHGKNGGGGRGGVLFGEENRPKIREKIADFGPVGEKNRPTCSIHIPVRNGRPFQ